MRNLFLASLSSLLLATASLSGCAPGGEASDQSPDQASDQGGATASTLENASASPTLVGEYRPRDGSSYPLLTLKADGTYVYDTGIRCIQAPCPSGDVGFWQLDERGFIQLVSTDPATIDPPGFADIVSDEPVLLLVEDASGVEHELARVVEAAPAPSCAAVRCAFGTTCAVVNGAAQCLP